MPMNAARWPSVLGLVCFVCSLNTCTHSQTIQQVEITTIAPASDERQSPISMASELKKVTGDSGPRHDAVRDVYAMLKAQEHEGAQKTEEAAQQWFMALARARGSFGEVALEGWIRTYTKALGKKSDRAVLARLILAESKGGHYSPYMIEKGLTTDVTLIPILEKVIPEWITTDAKRDPLVLNKALAPPASTQPLPSDRRFLKTSAKRCRAPASLDRAWATWAKSLSPELQVYWQGLIAHCRGQEADAIQLYLTAYKSLGRAKRTVPLAIEAAQKCVRLQRTAGQRKAAANTYSDLMALWQKAGVTAKSYGVKPHEFARRKINDALWAARYRALIGDYEQGKIFAQRGLEHISATYANLPFLSKSFKEELAVLKAEAYHILAYRIALERHEFEAAQSMTLLGLQSKYLTEDWKDRLRWFAGLYDYLGGHFDGARRRWESMLVESKDETVRPMLYFWLAKAYSQLGRPEESRFYLSAVMEDYPLSYYSVVAPSQSGLTRKPSWQNIFGSPSELRRKLKRRVDFNLASIRRDKTIGPLLLRAEILNQAQAHPWNQMATQALARAMADKLVLESHVGAFVYLSRLHYQSGDFLSSISLTAKLAGKVTRFWQEWPEQLLVYYPRPYSAIFKRQAHATSLDEELLLAISRQESGFRSDIKSYVGATGVMQLMEATAQLYRIAAGVDAGNLREKLNQPEANISIGSRYLKALSLRYKGFKPAIYGSYNAGEAAMDIWLKRRTHTDPAAFVELIPFGETKGYIKNVWRNLVIYHYIRDSQAARSATIIRNPPESRPSGGVRDGESLRN